MLNASENLLVHCTWMNHPELSNTTLGNINHNACSLALLYQYFFLMAICFTSSLLWHGLIVLQKTLLFLQSSQYIHSHKLPQFTCCIGWPWSSFWAKCGKRRKTSCKNRNGFIEVCWLDFNCLIKSRKLIAIESSMLAPLGPESDLKLKINYMKSKIKYIIFL